MDLIRQEDSSQATAPLQPESGLSVKQLLAAAGILFAVLCLFHGPLLIGTQIYCGGDVVNYFLPLRIQQLHHGWFAGWGPETFSGYPILDNIQSGAFYPLNWLHVVWGSPARVVTLLVLLNMYVGGIGMFCLLRGWCGMAASVLGAVAWMCSGYQLGKMAFGISVFMESLAWVPWMMLAIERQSWAAGRGRGWVGVLGLLGGIQLLAGAPQIVQITWAGLSVWTIGRFVAAPREARFALLKGFAVAVAITLMMAWPMLIGAMRFQANAVQRATEGGLAYLSTDSVQPHHLITWLAPGFFAPGNYEGVYWGGTTGWGEINAFVGSGLLVLALAGAVVALIGWRKADGETRRLHTMFLLLWIGGLLVAFGSTTPIFGLLVKFVPGFGLFRVPGRWSLWCVIATIFFGCRMVDWLLAPSARTRPATIAAWSVMGAILLAMILVQGVFLRPIMLALGVPQSDDGINQLFVTFTRAAATAALIATGLTMLALALAVRWPRWNRLAAACVVLVGIADQYQAWLPFTVPIGQRYVPNAPQTDAPYHRCPADIFESHFFTENEPVALIRSQKGRTHFTDTPVSFYYDQDSPGLQAERPAALGLEITRGYQQLRLAGYAEEYYSANMPSASGTNTPMLSAMQVVDRRFFDAYNVTLFLTHPQPGELPILATQGFGEPQAADELGMAALVNPGARGYAWLSESSNFLEAEPDPSIGAVTIREREAEHWTAVVSAVKPGWLHFSSPAYPGWEVTATGPSGEVLMGEDGRSIQLPGAGTWEVERRFERIGLRPGNLALAVAGLLAALWLIAGGFGLFLVPVRSAQV